MRNHHSHLQQDYLPENSNLEKHSNYLL